MRQARHIHVLAQTGQIRTATFEEREHLVVPVVALVEGVIHAVNSKHPELVLAEELAKTPQGWDGRPVMPNHPADGAGQISANDPHVLETQAFGRVFHSRVEGKRLILEAWLDPSKAEKVGDLAKNVISRVRAGEMVEVSVGAFVVAEEKVGTHRGKPFRAIWREIVPDHLAMLPEDTIGACSVEMGCGAPRAASVYVVQGDHMRVLEAPREEAGVKGIKEKFHALLELFKSRTAAEIDGQSDADLRQALGELLFASEPGFVGVEAVFPDDSVVVFAVAPEGELKFFKKKFEKKDDGSVSMGDESEEVKPVTKFEAAAGCGCGGEQTMPTAQEGADMNKKDLVKQILARKDKRFGEQDAAALEQLSEERLKSLAEEQEKEEVVVAPPPVAAPVATPVATSPQPQPVAEVTPEQRRKQLLDENPDIKEALEERAAQRAARRNELVTAIKSHKSDAYSDEDLKALPIEQLEKTVRLLASVKPQPKVDYSGLGGPRAASDALAVPPAPSLTSVIRVARGVEKAS